MPINKRKLAIAAILIIVLVGIGLVLKAKKDANARSYDLAGSLTTVDNQTLAIKANVFLNGEKLGEGQDLKVEINDSTKITRVLIVFPTSSNGQLVEIDKLKNEISDVSFAEMKVNASDNTFGIGVNIKAKKKLFSNNYVASEIEYRTPKAPVQP